MLYFFKLKYFVNEAVGHMGPLMSGCCCVHLVKINNRHQGDDGQGVSVNHVLKFVSRALVDVGLQASPCPQPFIRVSFFFFCHLLVSIVLSALLAGTSEDKALPCEYSRSPSRKTETEHTESLTLS